MDKKSKTYLMVCGTLFPAFVLVTAKVAYDKRANLTAADLLIFAAASLFGGYLTAKILK